MGVLSGSACMGQDQRGPLSLLLLPTSSTVIHVLWYFLSKQVSGSFCFLPKSQFLLARPCPFLQGCVQPRDFLQGWRGLLPQGPEDALLGLSPCLGGAGGNACVWGWGCQWARACRLVWGQCPAGGLRVRKGVTLMHGQGHPGQLGEGRNRGSLVS